MAIATLIAAGRLDDRLVSEAIERVPGARFDRWIDEGDCGDLHCDGDPAAIRSALEGIAGVDVAVQPGFERPNYRAFVADMDSTIIGQECIDELADYAGVKSEVAAITEQAMRGELDFAAALAARVKLLKGLDRAVLEQCRAERIRPNPGASTLVATLNRRGVSTNIVSGGFTDFVEPLARALEFDGMLANALGKDGDRLSGETTGAIVDADAKARFAMSLVESLVEQQQCGPEGLVAIGDGANDSGMVALAGLGIGYRPKPALDKVANAAIRHHDLTAVLWMMATPKAEWLISKPPGSRPDP